MRQTFKKLSERFKKIFQYRIINPLIKFSCKNNIPFFLYRFLFFIEAKKRKFLKIKRYQSYFLLKELFDSITIKWSFPSIHRSRSRSHYKYGLKSRAYELAISYKLDQIVFEDNDIVIDCGANYGDLWLYFKFKNKSINYLAIEPGKDELKTLKRNIKDLNQFNGNSKIYNFALGNENKETKFFYSPENADSSIIKPIKFLSTYKVKVKTLDTFFKEESLRNQKIKLLKLEAEGFEPEILYGGEKAIKNIEYIAADLGPERGVQKLVTLPDVTNFLLRKNFKIKSINEKRLTVLFENINLKTHNI
tara:strand:- start:5046 stop:5960 length:915 start_codon:yes stop_codon:yes gene_type:complete